MTTVPGQQPNHPTPDPSTLPGQFPPVEGVGGITDPFQWENPAYVVPVDFKAAIERDPKWQERTAEWLLTDEQKEFLLRYMHYRFVAGYGPDESNPTNWKPGGSIEDFMGGLEDDTAENRSDWAIYDQIDTDFFGSDLFLPKGAVGSDYTPSSGSLPEGWLTFWGEDDPVVDAWLDSWVDRFNQNAQATGAPGDPRYDPADLMHDFYNHEVDGLYAQDWWAKKTNNFTAMMQMWYTGGGPGTAAGGGLSLPSDKTWEEVQAGWQNAADWGGVGNWGKIWNDSIEIIRATAEDLGVTDRLSDVLVSQIAFTLMKEGGAAAHLEPQTAEGWPNQARQTVEGILIDEIRKGTFDQPLGVGSVQDIENRLRAYADSQMIDIDALASTSNTSVRDWALDIKSEKGLNESQVMSTIANQAHSEYGLTADQIESMGQPGTDTHSTISTFVTPLLAAASQVWEDYSYRKDDEWLMDNYQIVNEDGSKRFRTQQEMRALARTNLDRFQHSTQFQNPMNRFIQGAASMFRSDY